MKRLVVFLMTSMLLVAVAGCTNVTTDIPEESAPVETESEPTTEDESEPAVSEDEIREANTEIISDALGKNAGKGQVANLVDMTVEQNIGKLVGADYRLEDADRILYLMADDGTEYICILSSSYVEAVKNVTTDEWIITTYQ